MKNKDIEIFINEMMGYPKKLIKKLGGSIDEDLLKLNLGMPHFAIMDIILKTLMSPEYGIFQRFDTKESNYKIKYGSENRCDIFYFFGNPLAARIEKIKSTPKYQHGQHTQYYSYSRFHFLNPPLYA